MDELAAKLNLEGDSDQMWHEFELAIAEIAKLAKSDLNFAEFSNELLQRAIPMLAAVGGAVWEIQPAEPPRQLVHWKLDHPDKDLVPLGGAPNVRLVQQALGRDEVTVAPTETNADASADNDDRRSCLHFLTSLKCDHRTLGVLEIIQRPMSSSATIQGTRRMVSILGELTSGFLRRRETQRLRQAKSQGDKFESFIRTLNEELDTTITAYLLANEGRRYVDCDRLTVVLCRGLRFRVLAVSGVDSVNRRSNAVRTLEVLCATVRHATTPTSFDGDTSEFPPKVEAKLERFLEASHCKSLQLVPMLSGHTDSKDRAKPTAGRQLLGVLAVEQFATPLDQDHQQRLNLTAIHGGSALRKAVAFDALPTLPFARRRAKGMAGRGNSTWKWLLAGLISVALVVAALTDVDFNIAARGELQPLERREVFAPRDGEIVFLLVQHGTNVAKGDILLELRSPELELQLRRIEGEQQATRQRLLAVESSLLQSTPTAGVTATSQTDLAGSVEELKLLLKSLQEQRALLVEQDRKLVVRSPINGSIVTWEPGQLLSGRPVQRGQALLSVADVSGPWHTELEIPDDRVGYVLESLQLNETPVTVSFELARNRQQSYRGTLLRLADRTEAGAEDQPVVRAIVELEHPFMEDVQPGSTVFANLHCGKRSRGRVWLQDIYYAIRTWLYF